MTITDSEIEQAIMKYSREYRKNHEHADNNLPTYLDMCLGVCEELYLSRQDNEILDPQFGSRIINIYHKVTKRKRIARKKAKRELPRLGKWLIDGNLTKSQLLDAMKQASVMLDKCKEDNDLEEMEKFREFLKILGLLYMPN